MLPIKLVVRHIPEDAKEGDFMNAVEAKQLTQKHNAINSGVANELWNQAKEHIFRQIKIAAEAGNSTVKINLKSRELNAIGSKHLDKIRYELEKDGFWVDFLLERCLDGARELIVKW